MSFTLVTLIYNIFVVVVLLIIIFGIVLVIGSDAFHIEPDITGSADDTERFETSRAKIVDDNAVEYNRSARKCDNFRAAGLQGQFLAAKSKLNRVWHRMMHHLINHQLTRRSKRNR